MSLPCPPNRSMADLKADGVIRRQVDVGPRLPPELVLHEHARRVEGRDADPVDVVALVDLERVAAEDLERWSPSSEPWPGVIPTN